MSKLQKRGRMKPAWKDLPKDKYINFYKLLVHNGYADAAESIGLGQYYDKNQLRLVGYQVYKDIEKMGPESLGVSEEVVSLVKQAIETRKNFHGSKPHIKHNQEAVEWTTADLLDPSDTRTVTLGARNKAVMLIHKKLDLINSSKKALKETNLSQLTGAFHVLFDKSQIISGEATENISVLSKNINENMTAEESLDMILKMREQEMASKNKD